MPDRIHQAGPKYQNPTYPHSFPDPFVLKYNAEYFAYCTGHWSDGRIFGIMRSHDLINWTPLGGAMTELSGGSPYYWAPEVTYWNGTFYLYYSVGNEIFMELRVATSDRPDGGFEDSGHRLTTEEFAIDAHVFIDDDNQRYLFYATDFLEHTHIGTGVVVDRLLDWYTLEGKPHPVVRAKYDWQVYDPQRKEKGGVRWHTVEGPFVLKRKGRYFMMFSAGNWKEPTYGVSFAVTGDLNTPDEWRQFSDGDNILPILRTIPEKQVGPGHNCVVLGPNNRETYCVYHYWHNAERVLAVNRMDLVSPRIYIEDKPYLEKPFPFMPSRRFELAAENWKTAGQWNIQSGRARNTGIGQAEITSAPLPQSFLCEFGVCANRVEDQGRFGFRLESDTEVLGGLVLCVSEEKAFYEWMEPIGEERSGPLVFGSEFRLDVLHRLTIDVDGRDVCVKLDDRYLSFASSLNGRPERLVLFAARAEAAFSRLAVTEGFEDRFETDQKDARSLGWTVSTDAAKVSVFDGELFFNNPEDKESILYKGEAAEDFEFVVNVRLKGPIGPDAFYGFVLLDENDAVLERFRFSEVDGRMSLSEGDPIPLPFDFNTRLFHQFRFRKHAGEFAFDIESVPLCTRAVDAGKARVGIFSRNARVALETVRLTILNS